MFTYFHPSRLYSLSPPAVILSRVGLDHWIRSGKYRLSAYRVPPVRSTGLRKTPVSTGSPRGNKTSGFVMNPESKQKRVSMGLRRTVYSYSIFI